MITHFNELKLQTVSIEAVKQFYHGRLGFTIEYESRNEIRFKLTDHATISFEEAYEPISPAHFAFEVPISQFGAAISCLQDKGISFLAWPDGRVIDEFETGKNVYFKDCDGNLAELIAHYYVNEDVIAPSGIIPILYLREIGFAVTKVNTFREKLVHILGLRLDKVFDDFTFAIGGTAHAVITSTQRRWVPINMLALPPKMIVHLGASTSQFICTVQAKLDGMGQPYHKQSDDCIAFSIDGYRFQLSRKSAYSEETLSLLNLPS
ncbi:VOC family protein [Paenibacillus sp. MMS18-CY102]|uniref:VOC family protein n=1 Tax=Paenibacillus sp. MMS18-CY102 TaxID=2682849 RepID=UPI0013658F12|nr:VOC family protein [Paenibacillus sp. MMS18-CY102]MWC28963.1 glyoxalase/bleomycin resistance/dioxygenase family protein [Paenibacillus sp. MMS18-CY102]